VKASFETVVEKAAEILRVARHAVAFTGAGISTPSGIPDFTSPGTGLWERFDPMEVASIGIFRNNPEKFYSWLRPLLQKIWAAEPNPAHIALAQLEKAGILKAVITQNIDDLHQRAGSSKIYEVHGSLRDMKCIRCHMVYPAIDFQSQMSGASGMPQCPKCGQILKPEIVLYGEMLPEDTWIGAEEQCRWADAILVAGSSLGVWPAAALPEIGLEHGAQLIINNLTPTHLDSSADVLIFHNIAEAIPAISQRLL
jgi:NAD-dependent deacetylase